MVLAFGCVVSLAQDTGAPTNNGGALFSIRRAMGKVGRDEKDGDDDTTCPPCTFYCIRSYVCKCGKCVPSENTDPTESPEPTPAPSQSPLPCCPSVLGSDQPPCLDCGFRG
eukprot:gb/GEZN01023519.1/.p1 GENE.gb/GEZN01023519.1/~~gb/GEZN01023519.1/.p1  ORF type:complete len:119 (+),score=5.93 gb/GEZN01023519.1/:25-357(+)